jgi:hypothetical protein
MATIALTNGTDVLVDDCDRAWLSEWEWHLNKGYAACGQRRRRDGVYRKVLMHRLIALCMGLDLTGREVDHINRDRLDNRRSNLRAVSKSVNQHNSKLRADSSTGVKGVSVNRQGSYVARLQVNKCRMYLGRFSTLEEACVARNMAEERYLNVST